MPYLTKYDRAVFLDQLERARAYLALGQGAMSLFLVAEWLHILSILVH